MEKLLVQLALLPQLLEIKMEMFPLRLGRFC